jgi:hypothetical protein
MNGFGLQARSLEPNSADVSILKVTGVDEVEQETRRTGELFVS